MTANPRAKPPEDNTFLIKWPVSPTSKTQRWDILERTAIVDGTLRSKPSCHLIGKDVLVTFENGEYRGTIICTGLQPFVTKINSMYEMLFFLQANAVIWMQS